jgi:hypothetical protein
MDSETVMDSTSARMMMMLCIEIQSIAVAATKLASGTPHIFHDGCVLGRLTTALDSFVT